jgi:hypothetical protein
MNANPEFGAVGTIIALVYLGAFLAIATSTPWMQQQAQRKRESRGWMIVAALALVALVAGRYA